MLFDRGFIDSQLKSRKLLYSRGKQGRDVMREIVSYDSAQLLLTRSNCCVRDAVITIGSALLERATGRVWLESIIGIILAPMATGRKKCVTTLKLSLRVRYPTHISPHFPFHINNFLPRSLSAT